jgi:hypothetical protein
MDFLSYISIERERNPNKPWREIIKEKSDMEKWRQYRIAREAYDIKCKTNFDKLGVSQRFIRNLNQHNLLGDAFYIYQWVRPYDLVCCDKIVDLHLGIYFGSDKWLGDNEILTETILNRILEMKKNYTFVEKGPFNSNNGDVILNEKYIEHHLTHDFDAYYKEHMAKLSNTPGTKIKFDNFPQINYYLHFYHGHYPKFY